MAGTMKTLRYIVKRLLLAVLILFGVSIIIYGLARMMPTDFVDQQFQSAVAQGTMTESDIDRIKELYGLNMPDAYLDIRLPNGVDEKAQAIVGKRLRRNTKVATYEKVQSGPMTLEEWYVGNYEAGGYRIRLLEVDSNGRYEYVIEKITSRAEVVVEDTDNEDGEESEGVLVVRDKVDVLERGTYTILADGNLSLRSERNTTGIPYTATVKYSKANFWNKLGAILGGYFTWLGNLLQGNMGMSFKYKRPVEEVIMQNMGISFGIAFVATILQFLIAIPLGIKAAVNQYGVVDYTVTILVMIGISLPTFFLSALVIRVFATQLNWFPVGGIIGNNPPGTPGIVVFGDMLWHMVLPMFVLVILSVGSLMRYTRTNTLEVLNADYIRTARAKGLSERSVIYKHAFRNTMIPLVTMMAGILPSLFGGAMITETVFAIPGIGKLAYDALLVADVPFIMGYNMFLAIMTVIGTLLSDLMYAVVDPRVKLND